VEAAGTSNTPTNPSPATNDDHPADDHSAGANDDDYHHRQCVSPQRITVSPGTRVTFVNNDSRQHG
jgi:plastocyanin